MVTLAVGCIAAGACGSDDGADGGRVPLRVFAAASFAGALIEMETAFEQRTPGVDVQLNLAGSSALRTQILEGAPADVYVSADETNMNDLIARGAATTSVIVARNTMQLAVPAGNPAGIEGLADLADDDLLIGLCAETVPCGGFARRVLANAGIIASPDTNEADVRSLLTKIGTGELDAGIVYASDVAAATDIDGLDIAADVNVITVARAAVLTDSSAPAAAGAFVEFMLSPDGQSVLARNGFAT